MRSRGTNVGTNGIALDRRFLRADSAAMPPMHASSHIPVRISLAVSTALGFVSAFAAFYFVSTFTDTPTSFGLLLALNLGYWYTWAALTPAILWLTRRFPFARATWRLSIP